MNKKGYTIGDLLPIGISFVVIAVALAIGAVVLAEVQSSDSITSGSYAYNATDSGLQAVDEFSSWLPTLAIVVVAAIILGVLIFYLARKFM